MNSGLLQLDWAWELTAYALCTIAGLIVLWALFWDRPRGRKRCPGCWYDLAGATPVERDGRSQWLCPECGRTIGSERQMRRTRRHWRGVASSVVLLVGAYAAFAAPRVLVAGKIGFVPTSGLIWWVGAYEPTDRFDETTSAMIPATAAAVELARRVAAGQLWDWQMRWMIDALRVVRFRERWPRDCPYAVATGLPHFMLGAGVRLTTSSPLDVRMEQRKYTSVETPWMIGVLPPGTTSVPIDLTIGSWSTRVNLPVHQVDGADDAIQRAPESLTAGVQRSLDFSVIPEPQHHVRHWVNFAVRLHRSRGPVPDDVAIGIIVELVHDDDVVLTSTPSLRDTRFGDPGDGQGRALDFGAFGDGGIERWKLRIRGDTVQSLIDFDRTRYWAGTYEVPLADALRR